MVIVICYSVVLTEWYIRSGVAGIFSVCLSSEMFQVRSCDSTTCIKVISVN